MRKFLASKKMGIITLVYGSEENLREVLRDGGLAGVDIDALFKTVR